MNKYEKLFSEIYSQTKAGTLKWKQLRRQANSDLIFNQNFVWRQFAAEFERGENIFTIILVEKKYEDPDFDSPYEKYYPELLIIDGGELVSMISDSVIEKNDLIRLANLVEMKSDKAKRLFGP
ncbi:hypothetical protein MTR80_05535 [Alcaligenes aquatilis]|uniref:Uncharacterized protein n=1 Tax=Alcaligenes aquatilis TaxID=323284 RepID=A0ABY4NJH0_9BURK|nr:hypothetical protein [Alcaligenes aquatilis]UQN37164.1 hypothetical protein MTR80_05535 [Alcaligenes aquatilis]